MILRKRLRLESVSGRIYTGHYIRIIELLCQIRPKLFAEVNFFEESIPWVIQHIEVLRKYEDLKKIISTKAKLILEV